MSFIDPDLREQWQREAEANRERCRKAGYHDWRNDRCSICGVPDPVSQKPRVTIQGGDYRAVWNPAKGIVSIEKRSTDSLGAERWDAVDSVSSSQSRSEKSQWPVYVLLTQGISRHE